MVKSSYATEVIGQLEDAQDVGFSYVVFELYADSKLMQPHHWQVFDKLGAALQQRQALADKGGWSGLDDRNVYCWPIDHLIGELQMNQSFNNLENMNLNNLQNLKDEVKELRFNDKLLTEMEDKMQKGLPEFQLHDSRPGNKGVVDFTLHFKKSSQSDFFYLNKYDVYLNKTQALEEGQKYMVISKGQDEKPVFRSFQNPHEAIDYFKGQKGDSELASGKSPANKTTLATMEKDKVNYVAKDFQKTYYAPPITHTMYVEQGKGFSSEQAANLIQGRTVYRDDLVNLGGQPYKAWVMFDMDKGKDRNNNFQTRQFNDPGYGFNLSETLKEFNIKELTDPAKTEKIEESLRNGNRPLITTTLEGKEVKLNIEAVPRYGKINFYQENGKPEKREQFELGTKTAQIQDRGQSRELAETRGMHR